MLKVNKSSRMIPAFITNKSKTVASNIDFMTSVFSNTYKVYSNSLLDAALQINKKSQQK